MATKEELRAKLDELGAEQPAADAKKEELEAAVAQAEGSSEDAKEGLSPEGQEALAEMGEDSEAAKLADIEADSHGPLHLESPSERIMTGAVNEEHAKEQEEKLENMPEDYSGDVSEAGFDADGTPAHADAAAEEGSSVKDNLAEGDDRELREVRQEDVIDYPPAPTGHEEGKTIQQAPSGAFHSEPLGNASVPGARSRLFEQKSVFYTDGISGHSDHNFERAYEVPEVLQSNDPETRKAGDESLSEAAKDQKTDADKARADRVKNESE